MAEPSAVSAADRAFAVTARDLFTPFRFERWLALGFVAFLDQCGRTGGGNYNGNVPGAGGSRDGGGGGSRGGEEFTRALAWLAEHALLAAGIAAAVIAITLVIIVLVFWLQSRGTFMYLDNVATGRSDVRRPWREHKGRAGSYFAWLFGASLLTFVVVIALLVPIGWSGWTLMRRGAAPLPIVVLVLSILILLLVAVCANLFAMAMRDFVAPLQWYGELSCGQALRTFGRLLRENKLLFLVYVLLKIVFSIVLMIVTFAVCCLTCCCAMIPFVHQTLLQPVYYFERRWSLELLQQLGFAPPLVAPAPPPGPLMPPLPPPLPDAGPPQAPPDLSGEGSPGGDGPQGFARAAAEVNSRSMAPTAPSTSMRDVSMVWVACA
jgi:hypothetical protein